MIRRQAFFFSVGVQVLLFVLSWTQGYARTQSVEFYSDTIKLKEVSVSTPPLQAGEQTLTTGSIGRQEMIALSGSSLAGHLSTLAGVSVLGWGNIIKPVIHGLHSSRILILNNGIRQEGQQWGADHAPEIDPQSAGSIELVKGAHSIRYGSDAVAGVILLKPEPLPYGKTIESDLSIAGNSNGRKGFLSLRSQSSMPADRQLAFRIQASVQKGGDLKTAKYYLNNTGIRELNVSAALGYKFKRAVTEGFYSTYNSEAGVFEGAHLGNANDFSERLKLGYPPDADSFTYRIMAPRQKVRHDLYRLKSVFYLGRGGRLEGLFARQQNLREEYSRRRNGMTEIAAVNLSLNTNTIEANYTYSRGIIEVIGGLQLTEKVNYSIAGTGATAVIPNYKARSAGVFWAQTLKLRPALSVDAGLRFDIQHLNALGLDIQNNSYGGYQSWNNFSYALGFKYALNESFVFKSNAGFAWRAPHVSELYSQGLHHGSGFYEMGDSSLNLEKSLKWISTVNFSKDAYSLELSVYNHCFGNYIYLEPAGRLFQSFAGAFPVFNYRQARARFYGADIKLVYKPFGELTLHTKASLVRARNLSKNDFFPFIPTDNIEQSAQWNAGSLKAFKNLFLQTSLTIMAKQKRYDPDTDYMAPPAGYSLVKIAAGTDMYISKHLLTVSLTLHNLFNTAYKDYMSRYKYYAHNEGRNLSLRLNYKF